jgi:phage terminase large subunit-like protein
MVNGTAARHNGIVIGFTTAGDDTSELLIELYDLAEDAPERFGYFIWEAPEARVPDDDETLGRYLMAASPGLACGRLDLDTAISDVRSMAEADVIRYRLNRFTASTNAFITATLWAERRREPGATFPAGRPIFTIDRTPDWGFAAIMATIKVGAKTSAELVASISKPSLSQLVNVCVDLARHEPIVFAMDGYALKELGAELTKRGLPVWVATQGDVMSGSALLYAKLAAGDLEHAGDDLLNVQAPRTVRKNVGDGFRISRKDSSIEIDGVMALALGVLAAETRTDDTLQVF